MQKTHIAIVGHVCIDHNVSEHDAYAGWGSTALYMARYFQRLVKEVDVITTYGPDFLPYAEHFCLHPATPQTTATLLNENNTRGSKRIYHSHHVAQALPPEITPEVVALLEQADIFVLAPLLPNYTASYVKELLSHAPVDALKVLNVQGYLRDVDEAGLIHPKDFLEAAEILPLFDLAVLSDDDHPQAFDVALSWKKFAPSTNIIVTEGPLGASLIENKGSHNIPTKPVAPADIVDSVGCGDVFTAALAFDFYQTRDLISAIKTAHLAARQRLTERDRT